MSFEGDRGGEAALSWGQQSIWRSIRWLDDDDPYFNVPLSLPIPGDRPLDVVTRAVGALVERHEALRTTCVETSDGPIQRVARTGSLVVAIHDAGSDDPVRYADQVAADLATEPFRYERDLPLRCAIVLAGGRPCRLALALSHLSVDAWSIRILGEEWEQLLAGASLTAPAWQPLDRAAFERDGAGRVRGEESLQYWRSTLRAVPRSLFDYPAASGEQPRFVRTLIESPALAVAAERLADQLAASTSTVLTVAAATVLATFTGHRTSAMQLIVANRHDARFRGIVAPVAQDGLLLLQPSDGGTFQELVKHGHMQAMAAYRYGHYRPCELEAARAEAGADRGVWFDLSAFFNDVRPSGRWPQLPEVTGPDDLAALTAKTRTSFVGAWSKVDAKAFFATGPALDTGQLYLLVDTAFVPRASAFQILRGVEAVLVHCATESDLRLDEMAAVAGVEPVERSTSWIQIGPDWVLPDAVEDVVGQACGRQVAVTVDGRDSASTGRRLTAYLVGEPSTSPASVHERVMAELAGRTDAIAPHHYVLCAEPPQRTANPDQWRAGPRIAEGSGRRER